MEAILFALIKNIVYNLHAYTSFAANLAHKTQASKPIIYGAFFPKNFVVNVWLHVVLGIYYIVQR